MYPNLVVSTQLNLDVLTFRDIYLDGMNRQQTKIALETAKPKAQYFDALVERNLLTSFRITTKEFEIKRKDFLAYLLDNGYIYRDQKGNLLPYAVHVPHLFEVKEYCKDHHSGTQTLITPKGRETSWIDSSPTVKYNIATL